MTSVINLSALYPNPRFVFDHRAVQSACGGRGGRGPDRGGPWRRRMSNGVEASLRRLGTDYIDLYQIHFPDVRTPIEETMRALDDLVRQSKARYIGCSNFAAWAGGGGP